MLRNKTLVVIGGTSGIGLRVAGLALADGVHVVIGGRDQQRLDAALDGLGEGAQGWQVDSASRASLAAFFARVPQIDALFTPGAAYAVGDFAGSDADTAESPFRNKFWGQYWAVHTALPRLSADAGIVLMSGAASARPVHGAAAYAACNAAIEGLGRALATELAPRRVNVISPGTVDSALWQRRPAALREAAFSHFSAANLLGRVASVDEVAQAVMFLLGNGAMTGSTLYADGGYALR